jgi:putative spermidine/putrescine transport system substrate-binding protein
MPELVGDATLQHLAGVAVANTILDHVVEYAGDDRLLVLTVAREDDRDVSGMREVGKASALPHLLIVAGLQGIVIAALLSGGDAATWEKGQAKLKALKPSFKAFYTNDANSQQLIANGETPVQVILSMNAHYMAGEGVPIQLVIPKEGAVLGIDTVAIMKGSKKAELAYKFINVALDPQVQAEVAKFKKGSPVVLDAKLDPAVAKLPGVFTSVEQWNKQAIIIDHKLRAEKTAEWRKWFAENIMN